MYGKGKVIRGRKEVNDVWLSESDISDVEQIHAELIKNLPPIPTKWEGSSEAGLGEWIVALVALVLGVSISVFIVISPIVWILKRILE